MRRLLLLAALFASLAAPAIADAGGFVERFTTDPFRYPRRWCARAHGASWDSTNGLINVWKDTNTAARVTTTGCQGYSPTPVGEDAGSTFGRYVIRTALPFVGETRRTIRVRFGLPSNFSSTDTLEVFAALHPHCNAGVKVVLSSPSGDGEYQLKLDVADSADGTAATECAYQGGTTVNIDPSQLFALAADSVNKSRYEILMRVTLLAGGRLESVVKLFDLTVSSSTPVANARIPAKRFTKPVWWGRQAQFFGIAGNKASGSPTPVSRIEVAAQ